MMAQQSKRCIFSDNWWIILVNYPLNICCRYSLEAHHRGASNEHPQNMFYRRLNKHYSRTRYDHNLPIIKSLMLSGETKI